MGPPKSWDLLSATTAASRLGAHPLHSVGLLVGVALFFPGISVKVIAVDLPESRRVDVEKLERPDPLGALPEVQLWDDEPAGASVLGSEVSPVVLVGQKHVVAPQVRERDVRRVAPLAVSHHRDGLRPNACPVLVYGYGDH